MLNAPCIFNYSICAPGTLDNLEMTPTVSSLYLYLFAHFSSCRVDAIRDAEEERQHNLSNRSNPLDSELIKTKCLLRAPSLRDKKRERRKQDRELGEAKTVVPSSSSPSLNLNSSCVSDSVQSQERDAASATTTTAAPPESAANSTFIADTLDLALENMENGDDLSLIRQRDRKRDGSKQAGNVVCKIPTVISPPLSNGDFQMKAFEKRAGKDERMISASVSEIDSKRIKDLLKDIENAKMSDLNPLSQSPSK